MRDEDKSKEQVSAGELLKLNELRLEALVKLNQMTDAPLSKIAYFALEEAIRLTRSTIGYISFMNEDETVLTMHAWSKSALAECRIEDKSLIYPVETTGLWGEAVRQRRAVITNDYAAANPWKKGYPEGHVQIVRHMNVPIFDNQKIVIVAGVGNKPSDYDESDVRQLTLLMEGMWRIVQRKQAEDKLEQSCSLLQATLESTADGLLVIDSSGKIVAYNQKYAQMWRIPEAVLVSRDDDRALGFVLEQLTDPEAFLRKVRELYGHPEAESYDLIEFKDGRFFERYSQPQRVGQALVGRVWSFRDVTAGRQAEEALRESEEQYRSLFQNNHSVMLLIDPETGAIVDANPAACSYYGFSKEELLTKRIIDLNTLTPEQVFQEMQKAKTEKRKRFEFRHRLASGEVRDVEVFSGPIRVKGKELLYSIVQDVTARKQAEEALRESEAKYRLIFESNPQPLWVYDLESLAFLKVNRAAMDLYGYSREEFLAMTIKDIRPPEDVAPLLKRVKELKELTPGLGHSGEWRHVKKSGEIINVEIISHEIELDGRRARLVLAKDITASKAAEEALQESEEKHRKLMETANDAILIAEVDTGVIIDANPQAQELLGLPLERIIGMHQSQLHPPGETEKYRALFRDHCRTGGIADGEILVVDSAGRYIPVEISAGVIEVRGKNLIYGIFRDLTERRRSEEALRRSEEKYRLLVNQIPAVVFKGYADWSVDFFDNKIEILSGYSREEFDSRKLKWSDLILPEDLGEAKGRFVESMKTNGAYGREYRIRTKDGGVAWVQAMGQIFYDAEGKLDYVSGVFFDITERKKAEEELRNREAKLSSIFRAAPTGIGVVADRVLREVNDRILEMTGYFAQELLGQSARMLYPTQEDFDFVGREKYRQIMEKGTGMVETRWRRKDGSIIEVLLSSTPIVAGDLSSGVTFTALDITERRRAEEALRRSEEKYRLLVGQIPAVVYKGYTDWSLDCFDRKIEEITGYAKEEFDSRRRTWLDLIFPEDIDQAKKLFKEALVGDGSYVSEHRIHKKTGEIRWIQARNRIICDAAGKVEYISGVFFDITERKELEDQLNKAQRMEAVGILAGGLAHDFNNLLTAIMGYSEIMMMGLRKEDPFYLYVEEITKAANRGAALTNQLLTFSRKQILQPRVFNLNEVVIDMDKMLQRLIGEDIELITFIDQELGFVKADPGQIEQILMNLAVNARDAMPDGGKLTVETANVDLDESYARSHVGATPGPYVMLAMSDNGLGMDAATAARIFEPFFTTKESGKGTGLGLATVYGIVQQSGGHIWVYSEPGIGATFKVYLPRVEGRSEEGKPKVITPTTLEGEETILVVEDDTALRELISTALRRYGFKVLEAAHGGEALLICERQETPIHLMLTDVVMPQISGTALAGRLQRLHPEMKVLYMSGYTENAIVHHGVLDAKVNFIPKPFRMLGLVRKVREVLDSPGEG